MKALLTCLALGCLLAGAATLPPLPPFPSGPGTNKLHRLPTSPVKRVMPAIPDPTGRSYTNVISSLPEYWRAFNGVSVGTNFVPINVRHDTNASLVVLDWASEPGQRFVVWSTGGRGLQSEGCLYPWFFHHTNGHLGTQAVSGILVAHETVAWVGTNRTWLEIELPRGLPGRHWLVERKT